MRSHRPQGNDRSNLARYRRFFRICFGLLFSCGLFLFVFSLLVSLSPSAEARSAATPWNNDMTNLQNFQSLVYGASTSGDVVRAMGGMMPDEVVRSQQMFPVIENHYYYDENKTGAATIFVFENGLLVGLQLKTAGDQLVDMTYFLTNNGDRALNQPMLGGYMPYYPIFPLTTW